MYRQMHMQGTYRSMHTHILTLTHTDIHAHTNKPSRLSWSPELSSVRDFFLDSYGRTLERYFQNPPHSNSGATAARLSVTEPH